MSSIHYIGIPTKDDLAALEPRRNMSKRLSIYALNAKPRFKPNVKEGK